VNTDDYEQCIRIKDKKEEVMKKKKKANLRSILWIIAAVAFVLAISPVPALSQDIECAFGQLQCNSPGDGLEENSPLSLANQTSFPICSSLLPSDNPDRAYCLYPDSKDLFVILKRLDVGSLIPTTNPFEFISKPTMDFGLGIAIHPIVEEQTYPYPPYPERAVVLTPKVQKAVRIKEISDITATEPLGAASEGTPNMQDDATIFTGRIKKHVEEICAQATETVNGGCWDGTVRITDQNINDFIAKYVKHTIAHETAHMLGPLRTYNDRRIGHHYPTGTNAILDQQVYYKVSSTKTGTKVTWYIGVTFTPDDIANARLY
jgi:hypothetical protein